MTFGALQVQTLPLLPVMAATFPRSGVAEWASVAEQAVELLASIRSGKGRGDELDDAVDEAFEGVMKGVMLLQGVAS